MNGKYFVNENSIVRQIWGNGDTILLIFAGAAAEFAVNKAVDWLYFTGRLPADPLSRLFSTVSYARSIVFSEHKASIKSIDSIAAIHKAVEEKRGAEIPDWAYRDVLFMLIHYSIVSYEVLERRLSTTEKHEIFDVFYRIGSRMGISDLPITFEDWEIVRTRHMSSNLEHSLYTDDLFLQYKKHLGALRYRILLESQILVVPRRVRELLRLSKISLFRPLIWLYKLCRFIKADWVLKELILPDKYKDEVRSLDTVKPKRGCPFSGIRHKRLAQS